MYRAWEIGVAARGRAYIVDRVNVDAGTGRLVDRPPQIFAARNRTIVDAGAPAGVFVPQPARAR